MRWKHINKLKMIVRVNSGEIKSFQANYVL